MAMFYLFTDGGSRGNPGKAASAAFLLNDDGKMVDFVGNYLGQATNNEAEYDGLYQGVKLAHKNGVTDIVIRMDSELIVNQINGIYKVKEPKLAQLNQKVRVELERFTSFSLVHVRREENKHADKLVNLVLDTVG
jgi:ribonuclease HI